MDGHYWSINRLVEGFTNNDIQLPEIQRKYVWSKRQVLALIDSIYKGHPSGSMLLWETCKRPKVRAAATSKGSGRPSPGPSYILLDGYQRLASLAAVLAGMPVRSGGSHAEAEPVEAYFDMGHPERPTAADTEGIWKRGGEGRKQGLGRSDRPIFRMKGMSVEDGTAWASVAKLFKVGVASIFIEKNIEPSDPNYVKYLERLNRLRSAGDIYRYPVQIIDKDVTYEEVRDILARLGCKEQA